MEAVRQAKQRVAEIKEQIVLHERVNELREENALLREELRMVEPFLPPLRRCETWENGDITRGTSPTLIRRWYERVDTAEEEAEEDWDEETVARAQAEMIAAHRATPAAGASAP